MASILLSFVGQQDPFSDKVHANESEQQGSIVTLVNHLIKQDCEISKIFLLYTESTYPNAKDTLEWLLELDRNLSHSNIEIVPVASALSQDPVNNLLALQAARLGLEQAQVWQTLQDSLELNASSGTPAMKSAWSLLQAAGYAPRSRVWQVRNPKEIGDGQSRVFSSDVTYLRREFDLNIAKQQVKDYNYSGALSTLTASGLENEQLSTLLSYGRCRLAFDFNKANDALEKIKDIADDLTVKEIAELRQNSLAALSRECYLNAQTKLKNQEYAEFLTLLSCFQENTLRALIYKKTNIDLRLDKYKCWSQIQRVDDGRLYEYLEKTQKEDRGFTIGGHINTLEMLNILSFYSEFQDIRASLNALRDDIEKRNDFIHRLKGTSEIANQSQISANMRQILKKVADVPKENPFDRLNRQIVERLDLTERA